MADDEASRRREIRRRKILEGSEARLKKITNTVSANLPDENKLEDCNEEHTNNEHSNTKCQLSENLRIESNVYDFTASSSSDKLTHIDDTNSSNGQFSGDDIFTNNGNLHRTSALDSYTFPKKVSDAETRSFGRTRCDARRSSTCTQLMMENFQFYSFSLTVLRPWLTSLVAFMLRMYFVFSNTLPGFETIYFPLMMLEVAFSTWSQLESQIFNKSADGPMISGILVLCGFSETLISKFNSVWNIVNCVVIDFTIYTFFFVFSHFICELCM